MAHSSRHAARLQFESNQHAVQVQEDASRSSADPEQEAARAHCLKAGELEKEALLQYPHGVPVSAVKERMYYCVCLCLMHFMEHW